jgi:hypothetical protein
MSMEELVEWELAGETEVLGEILPQCHFGHHKSHMTLPGIEPGIAAVESRRLTAWYMESPHRSDITTILQEAQISNIYLLKYTT